MKHTESEYINVGFNLERGNGWRRERTIQKIELMLSQEAEEDKPEAFRLINIGKAEARR
jgi:hypothetical protein